MPGTTWNASSILRQQMRCGQTLPFANGSTPSRIIPAPFLPVMPGQRMNTAIVIIWPISSTSTTIHWSSSGSLSTALMSMRRLLRCLSFCNGYGEARSAMVSRWICIFLPAGCVGCLQTGLGNPAPTKRAETFINQGLQMKILKRKSEYTGHTFRRGQTGSLPLSLPPFPNEKYKCGGIPLWTIVLSFSCRGIQQRESDAILANVQGGGLAKAPPF